MASEGGAAMTVAEESLKAEEGTASEVGAATAKTMAETLKELQDMNRRLSKEVRGRKETLMDKLIERENLNVGIRCLQRDLLEYGDSKLKKKLEKAKPKVTSGVSEGETSKRKTARGQHAMRTRHPRLSLRVNQQETTACASKAVSRRMSGDLQGLWCNTVNTPHLSGTHDNSSEAILLEQLVR